MRIKQSLVLLCLVLLSHLTLSEPSMPMLIPEAYSDGFAYIDGEPAPRGVNITVHSVLTNEIVGEGVVADDSGIFSVDIILDNPLTDVDEGASNFEPVKWCMDGIEVSIPHRGIDKAESGELNMGFEIHLNSSGQSVSCSQVEVPVPEAEDSNIFYYKTFIGLLLIVIILLILIVFSLYLHKK
ncbi:MAG: hypothetical protein ABH851_01720 [Methanobacteriota archaeon]